MLGAMLPLTARSKWHTAQWAGWSSAAIADMVASPPFWPTFVRHAASSAAPNPCDSYTGRPLLHKNPQSVSQTSERGVLRRSDTMSSL